ncbi:hypothetical protein BD289DRAFT_160305 [Coniella lustricola]|uniref:Uncharacterized protein n=1 Tax=Coniella lustricola TaxID=2025994 RepID=A0A2T2ZUJ7_9PEZI|nr:hypothetical protein BD289DRAFT_160305 [Coniella lustricola]
MVLVLWVSTLGLNAGPTSMWCLSTSITITTALNSATILFFFLSGWRFPVQSQRSIPGGSKVHALASSSVQCLLILSEAEIMHRSCADTIYSPFSSICPR